MNVYMSYWMLKTLHFDQSMPHVSKVVSFSVAVFFTAAFSMILFLVAVFITAALGVVAALADFAS